MNWELILEHLFIVLAASLLAVAVGLPLGIAAYVWKSVRGAILRIVDLLQTIPTLALLGIIMVFAGAGKGTVIAGITLYSLLPIVRNTVLGLQQVDPGVKEAARGMGMSKAYRVLRVELPLAFPTVFTGIRIAVVNAIGTAVFAAFVGGGGLGSEINQGIRVRNMSMILIPTAVLMAVALILDLLMGWMERRMQKKSSFRQMLAPAVIFLAMFAAVLPFGVTEDREDPAKTVTMYDLNYTEPKLLARMAKLVVEEHTDLTVKIKDEMTNVNAFNELAAKSPSCDMIVSYDGTVLTTYLHKDTADIPEGESLYDYVNRVAMEQYGVRLLGKLGLNNTYAIAVPEKLAEEKGYEKISDLVPDAGSLVFGAEHEFFTEEGSMKYGPFVKFYGLDFRDAVTVDIGLKYSAIENGNFQVTEVYATDGLNRKAGLKVLTDDQAFFPEYNSAFLVRDEVFDRVKDTAPDLEEVLNLLEGQISTEDMVNLTYDVDVLGKDLDETAENFLAERGLIER